MSKITTAPDTAVRWESFGDKPLQGVFWACGTYPEYDIDVDDDGRMMGAATGEQIPFVALVEIDFEPGPNGVYEVSPVNRYATGDFDPDEYAITHCAPFEMPKPIGS